MFTFYLVYRVLAQNKTSIPIILYITSHHYHYNLKSNPIQSNPTPVRYIVKSCQDFTPGNRTLHLLLLLPLFYYYYYCSFFIFFATNTPYSLLTTTGRNHSLYTSDPKGKFVHIIRSTAPFPFCPFNSFWNNLEEGYKSPQAYGRLFFFFVAGFTGS